MPIGLNGLQALVIEDATDVLEVFTMLLQFEGADVAEAASGREALTAFGSRHFDVVVCDLGLPDTSGDVLIGTIVAAARRPLEVVDGLNFSPTARRSPRFTFILHGVFRGSLLSAIGPWSIRRTGERLMRRDLTHAHERYSSGCWLGRGDVSAVVTKVQ